MPIPSPPPSPVDSDAITKAELALATRNHGMPLEAMRWDHTPVGLHYLLVHYDVPMVDSSTWQLTIDGAVQQPRRLSFDELCGREAVTISATMECAGNGRALLRPRALSQPWLLEAVGTAAWTGVRLADVLDDAGILESAIEVLFTGLDRGVEGGTVQSYARSLTVDQIRTSDALLAYSMNGAPLPPQHGYPVRLVVPGWYGMANVKWLTTITAITEAFDGYQNATAYRIRTDKDDPGRPVSRIVPRALLVPPGIPDFFSRHRVVPEGPCLLEGRAWSGWAPIDSVDVSFDAGASWAPAVLDPAPADPHAWTRFTLEWTPAGDGDFELRCQCRDRAGNRQPDDEPWNVGGYSNNAAQRIPVTVTSR